MTIRTAPQVYAVPSFGFGGVLEVGPAGGNVRRGRCRAPGWFPPAGRHQPHLLRGSVGGTVLRRGPHPGIELGVLRNHYQEGAGLGDFGQPTVGRTLYDLFQMGRVRIF